MSTASREPVTAELVDAWHAFGPAFFKWMTAGEAGEGLTFARVRVLKALHHHGPQIMSGIRDELGVTARSVTALVDALESDDLVRRTPHPSDRRATVVELTETGRAAIAGTHDVFVGRARSVFGQLDEDDQRTLLRILRTLGRELADLGGLDPRACGGFPPEPRR